MESRYILLVEDSSDDESLTVRALRKGNIKNRVEVVRDGAEALDYLFCKNAYAERNPEERPQVIFLDLKLPKVDGLEVLRAVRANEATKSLAVVILTSSREDKDIIEGYNSGANSYVCKPVGIGEFNQVVQTLGSFWLLINETVL